MENKKVSLLLTKRDLNLIQTILCYAGFFDQKILDSLERKGYTYQEVEALHEHLACLEDEFNGRCK